MFAGGFATRKHPQLLSPACLEDTWKAPVAQRIEQSTPKAKVVGSIPAWGTDKNITKI